MKTKNTIGPAELISEAVNTITTQLTEALTLLVHRGEEVAERAEAIKVPAKRKAKAKAKANRYTHAHKGVKLTALQWAVWVAIKALLDAKAELVENTKDEGFDHLSGKFVAQFIGTPSNRKEQGRINQLMGRLKKKGLLTWVTKEVGPRKLKIKSGIAFGPEA
jgi:hypothetical protein